MRLIRNLFFFLNILAVLALFASSFAGAVRPSHFIWFSLLSYGFVLLVLLNVAFALVWLFFGKKEFLLSVAAIALRFALIPGFYQTGGCSQSEEESLRLLTFNVHHFHGRDFVADVTDLNVIDSNAHQFFDIVDSLHPQLLCMEEFTQKAHNTDVGGALEARGYRYGACATPRTSKYGVVLYSKLPIVAVSHIDSSSKMSVDVKWGEDTLRLFCLHLDSYQLNEDDYKEIDHISHGDVQKDSIRGTLSKFKQTILLHEEEWDVLRPLIEESPYPVILAGDFNDTPASYIYRKMIKMGLQDSFKEQGSGLCTTYHGKFPAFRIDYIMHSAVLDCLAYRRVKSDISDHYPVFAQFTSDHDAER